MAKRKVASSEVRDKLKNSFGGVHFEPDEDSRPRWRSTKKEFTPLATEGEFKQDKLDYKLSHNRIDKLDARDMLLFFKNNVIAAGNKCPTPLHGNQHNLMKTLIQKYGSRTVYSVIKFLFEAEHTFINKRVISLHYISKNIDWLQAYGDMYVNGEDYTELMSMCKPVQKGIKKSTRVREADYSKDEGDDW